MKAILQAWQDVKDEMIVFFDELHLVFGAITGEKSNIDAASLLKPALACGDLRCIGSTTTDEYNTHTKGKDKAFERLFVTVELHMMLAQKLAPILDSAGN